MLRIGYGEIRESNTLIQPRISRALAYASPWTPRLRVKDAIPIILFNFTRSRAGTIQRVSQPDLSAA
jgi:hypothetical protein